MELAGVLVIGLGIASVGLVRRADGLRDPQAAALALVTGGFIASYSLVDGLGARQAGTALGFYGWLAIVNAAVFTAIPAVRRPALLREPPRDGRSLLLAGGGASFGAYALVVWSFTQAPIALVTALGRPPSSSSSSSGCWPWASGWTWRRWPPPWPPSRGLP